MSTGSIQELEQDECRELLAVGRFARIAFHSHGRLQLLPVNYAYDHDLVLINTSPTSALATIVGNDFIFEADYHDDLYQVGWSVTVRGTAARATEAQLAAFSTRLPHSWVGGDDLVHIVITAEEFNGRRARAFHA